MHIQRFFLEEDGQALVEYGMLIALIALVCVSAVTIFGQRNAAQWGNNLEKFPTPPPPPP